MAMSNAGEVNSQYATYYKPRSCDVMEAFDDLPDVLRRRLCNAILDWDTRSVLTAWRDKKIPIEVIVSELERMEREVASASQ
jgi:hypothetical protein